MKFITMEVSGVVDELLHALAKHGIAGDALEVSHNFLTRGEVDPLEEVMGPITSESCACKPRSLYIALRHFEQNIL